MAKNHNPSSVSTVTELRPLTNNERRFVHEIMRLDEDRPRSAIDAYYIAYNTSCKRTTASVESSRIMAKPHIKAEIDKINREREMERRRNYRLTAVKVQNALWKEAETADRSSDRISALRALATMIPPVDPNNPDEEIQDTAYRKEALIENIKKLMSESLGEPIDVTPSQDEDQESEQLSVSKCANLHNDPSNEHEVRDQKESVEISEGIHDDDTPVIHDVEIVSDF